MPFPALILRPALPRLRPLIRAGAAGSGRPGGAPQTPPWAKEAVSPPCPPVSLCPAHQVAGAKMGWEGVGEQPQTFPGTPQAEERETPAPSVLCVMREEVQSIHRGLAGLDTPGPL